jgi:predicted nucleic acid-binding protein
MTALLDSNVVLDILLVRQPWFADSAQVWDAHRNGEISAVIAAFTVPTVFYVVRRQRDLADAHDAVRICVTTLDVVPVRRSTLELARTLPGSDYEDNLQIACAIEANRDSIVTRNPNDFVGAPMPVLTPAELVARLSQRAGE